MNLLYAVARAETIALQFHALTSMPIRRCQHKSVFSQPEAADSERGTTTFERASSYQHQFELHVALVRLLG